jgi:hypothetical protein
VVEGRQVVAAFDGGRVTSDAGALLLGAANRAIGLVRRLARGFTDGRAPELVEHTVETMLMQRICGIALGYEDLVDHDELRHDPVLAALAGKLEAKRKDCAPLAGKSTLNRLEHAPASALDRYHKIGHDPRALEELFVALFLEAHAAPPEEIVLDLDATDDPLHGHQEGRFFHGYYDCYCYLPLYVFCGQHLLAAKLRRSNIDASAGAVEEVERIVRQIRARWPRVKILLRADSGFARDELMAWCEANAIDYLFGLARAWLAPSPRSWPQPKPRAWPGVVLPAALPTSPGARWTAGAAPAGWSPRPSICPKAPTRVLSSPLFRPPPLTRAPCTRMSTAPAANRIKEQQLDLFADRTSAATMRANQLRLWFASSAYLLLAALRRIGLRHTQFATATCGTIRLKLLKIGAQVRKSVRRIKVAMASAFPYQAEYHLAYLYLRRAAF